MLNNLEQNKDIVMHFLKCYPETRENDLLLIMKVCERKGYCKHMRSYRGDAFFFLERDMKNVIPRSFFDTIRRTRQKIQEEHPELKPSPEMQDLRKSREADYQANIKDVFGG